MPQSTSMRPEDIWYGKQPAQLAVRLSLVPLSWIYRTGWQIYALFYKLGFKKAAKPYSPIVCIGNLVVGGSGKTPVTIHLCRVLHTLGYRVVISASGYGFPMAAAAQVAPDGEIDPLIWGDEPAYVRSQLPEVPLIIGRQRVLAAELAAINFPDHVLLMDDGFQHLPLAKDLSILLDDPNGTNRFCLPAGPYREPFKNLKNADLVVPGRFLIVASKATFSNADGLPVRPDEYQILCALGQPDKVVRSIKESLGVEGFRGQKLLADHASMQGEQDLDGLISHIPIIVTGKDWVKLKKRADLAKWNFVIAVHSVTLEPQNEFTAWLQENI